MPPAVPPPVLSAGSGGAARPSVARLAGCSTSKHKHVPINQRLPEAAQMHTCVLHTTSCSHALSNRMNEVELRFGPEVQSVQL